MNSSQNGPVEFSVIITFHNEGYIAHKTMQNVFELIEPFKQDNIPLEIIIHIDNGDQATIDYLSRYEKHPNARIFQNHFGNPADSRNFATSHARGKYVALLDGDDLVSKNWLIDGYHMLKESEPTQLILHTETDITFGANELEPRVWVMSDSRSDDEDRASMFTRNRWSAGTILPREVALQFPYRSATHGYGYEDWVFNMDTRNAGIIHKVVPKSVKFYRLHDNSTYSTHSQSHVVTAYSYMFSTPAMQKLAKRFQSGDFSSQSPNTSDQRLVRLARRLLRSRRDNLPIILPQSGGRSQRALRHFDRQRGQKTFSELPQHVQEAWIAANQIDGEAWPDPLKLGRLWYYDSDFNDQTELYCRLVSQIRQDPDYLFLPPQLSIGGTEKVLVNYINAFAELHPDWHIVVLSALPEKHPYRIPKNVDFVDFYGLTRGKSWFEIDFILSRFIVQTKVKRLHLIHNEIAFLWARDHLALIRDNDYRLYISQFMDEYNKDPRLVVGFVDPWIRDLAPAITKVFTDNEPFAQEIIRRTGLKTDQVIAHFQPVETVPQKGHHKASSSDGKFHILWASRISPQKRPDLLKQIARELDPTQYAIDIYGRFQSPYDAKFFKDIAKVATYRGVYHGIESLDLSQYDTFLYTSQVDGLPNVLLEIADAGLPIVASDVGGVSDIVNTQTGYPVSREDIGGYVGALREIHDDLASAQQKAVRAHKIVQTRHTWPHFTEQVKKDID